MLVRSTAPSEKESEPASTRHCTASWLLSASPTPAATLACPPDRLAGLVRRLGPDALGARFDDFGAVVIPDAEGPGRRDLVAVAAAGRPAAIGPDVELEHLPLSWQLATAALEFAD